MTNFENLKAEILKMTVEEFDERFKDYVCDNVPENLCDNYKFSSDDCNHCRKAWLESEAKE